MTWLNSTRHHSVQTRGPKNVGSPFSWAQLVLCEAQNLIWILSKKIGGPQCRETVFRCIFCLLTDRWRPAHTSETEDEDHEPLAADAECGKAQCESPEEPD